MNAPNPVIVTPDPETPDEKVVTARFNRKKILRALGTATAVVGAAAMIFGAGKKKGKNDFIDDVRCANGDDTDEAEAS